MRTPKVTSLLVVICRPAALAFCSAALAGCAGYTLFSADPAESTPGWHQYITPRSAENSLEKAVIEVAQTMKNSAVAGSDVLFIADDVTKRSSRVHCVDVVSKSAGKERYAKKVVRYRVVDGKIAAVSDASTEFFIDAELERAVLSAVARTFSPDPVIIYNDGGHMMSIASHAINRCIANVEIFEGDAIGTPMASKRVAMCFSS